MLSELWGLCGVGSGRIAELCGSWVRTAGAAHSEVLRLGLHGMEASEPSASYSMVSNTYDRDIQRKPPPLLGSTRLEVSQCHFHNVGHSCHKGAWAWGRGEQGLLNLWLETPLGLPIRYLHYNS